MMDMHAPLFANPGRKPKLFNRINVLLTQPIMSSVKQKLMDPRKRSTELHAFRSESWHSTPSFVNQITDEFISRQLRVNRKIGIMYDSTL